MIQVDTFSKGKVNNKNEDAFKNSDTCFVVADGATDKSNKKYDGKTGGEIVANLIVKLCIKSKLNGFELVEYINTELHKLYKKYRILSVTRDPMYRFTAVFVVARLIEDKIVVTIVGDVGLRINGNKKYQFANPNGEIHAKIRSDYIKKTGDIEGGRSQILPIIIEEYKYQNHPSHKLGYGVVDGTKTPKKYVEIFKYNVEDINTIELFSDGYYDEPKGTTIEDWERMYARIEKEDPYKYKKYLATKPKDDRTIMIINIK